MTFAHLDRLLDGVVTVTEEEIARAMLQAATAARLVVEPSGATALAAWLVPSGGAAGRRRDGDHRQRRECRSRTLPGAPGDRRGGRPAGLTRRKRCP